MGTRSWLALFLAMMMTLGTMLPVAAQRPDPHAWDTGTPEATPASNPASSGCDLIEPYVVDLYTTIDESGAFADFFYSDPDFGEVSADEAEQVIRDGNAMIETLNDLDVPPPYVEAHESIVLFLEIDIDMARFYGLDTSVVPDLKAYRNALNTISNGEVALAEACPDEVAAVGGYILVDPAEEPPVDPENIPE